jgi:hypothetical protein
MSDRKVFLSIDVVRSIIDPLFVKSVTDRKFIIDALISMLDDSNLQMFLSLLQKKDYKPLERFDYVKFKYDKASKKFTDEYYLESLEDKGCVRDGYLFGRVLSDSSWHTNFNPYYHSMKVEVYAYDEDKGIRGIEEEAIDTLCLEKCDKLDMPFFKLQNDAKQ